MKDYRTSHTRLKYKSNTVWVTRPKLPRFWKTSNFVQYVSEMPENNLYI